MKDEYLSKEFWDTHALVAVDECRMEVDNKPSLTIGNTYSPSPYYKGLFNIIDDRHDIHFFEWGCLDEFFKVVEIKKTVTYGYLCSVEGEKLFVIAENISDCFDKLSKTGKHFKMEIHNSIPII